MDFDSIEKFHTSYRVDGKMVSPEEYLFRKERGDGKSFVEPWDGIGYHIVIEEIKGHVRALIGRMPNTRGAHCRELEMNTIGIGICCVGDFDLAPPSDEILAKALDVCRYFSEILTIPKHRVIGHHEAQILDPKLRRALKTCPGEKFDMAMFRASI